jgi:hypothetical protein
MRRGPRGYALLTVLFFGAVMAITFYTALPRAAFEAQREREDDLIYRGSQYARAVQLFYRKFKTYPAKIEDLEKGRNIRFLRRKYVDPITKKDEWRFIHIGPAGVFTDSLVYDKPKQKKEGEPETAADSNQGQTITGIADRLRANIQPGQATVPGPEAAPFQPAPQQPQQPGYFAVGGVVQAAPAAFPGGPGAGPRPPGLPGVFGQPQPAQQQQQLPQGQSAFVAAPGLGSEAARIIGQLLTTPRPGGLAGIQGGQAGQPGGLFGAQSGGAVFGGGIAGVASKSEARGIKVFNERENYNEWEFVYDYRKDPLLMGAMGAAGTGVPGQQTGLPGQQPGMMGQPGMQPGVFGQPGAFGQPGVFGQPGMFGQQPGTPIAPINPSQPGLPGSPFGAPGGGRPTVIAPGVPQGPGRR